MWLWLKGDFLWKGERIWRPCYLLQNGRISNAAVLLFGKQPQRFVMGSEVKCAHFYGMEVTKPIPSYQVYKGDLFELVRQAVGFVLSRIDLSVGTRDRSIQVDTEYELPVGAVTEAIVNAIVHKDYSSYGSVQVMLFRDRLEIWNPGALPYGLTPAKLREPHTSIPANPLLAEPMYLTGYIERMGTGTGDIIKQCVAKGLREPEFVQEEEFRVVLWRNGNLMNDEVGRQTKEKTKEKTVGETVGETALRILQVIEEKPDVTRKELTEIVGLSIRRVEWNLAQLKAKGFIERVGATKKGYWKINRKE
ncbi:ATP-binding protein [Butyricimonas paravirosa]|uniref:ATP-binding protein n=1 Tax=Butyricimonas paravirosa TaxID=1472417 RepID=UPI00210E9246|nr:winged helix-turn-helix transcriptional regulator [Butyricimonas paravirosa]